MATRSTAAKIAGEVATMLGMGAAPGASGGGEAQGRRENRFISNRAKK